METIESIAPSGESTPCPHCGDESNPGTIIYTLLDDEGADVMTGFCSKRCAEEWFKEESYEAPDKDMP